MTQMIHKHCGGVIAESVNPHFRAIPGMLVQCNDFYIVGTKQHPVKGSKIICPKCEKQVSIRELDFSGPDEEESDCIGT